MAYTPTVWNAGDVITADKMNKLEQGVQNEQVGPQGPPGVDGATGPQGPAGPGVPTGGGAGQILAKSSSQNYDTHWIDPPEGSGGASGVTSFAGRSGAVTPKSGDYTAALVGAATPAEVSAAVSDKVSSASVKTIQPVTQTEYDALATKVTTTLYLIKE